MFGGLGEEDEGAILEIKGGRGKGKSGTPSRGCWRRGTSSANFDLGPLPQHVYPSRRGLEKEKQPERRHKAL